MSVLRSPDTPLLRVSLPPARHGWELSLRCTARRTARKSCPVDELWSGDRAALTRVVELYESTGEHIEAERVLQAFPAEQHDDVRHSLRRLDNHG